MRVVRLKSVVDSPVHQEANATRPYVALEHVEPEVGRLLDGYEPVAREANGTILFEVGDVLFGKLRPYLAKVLAPPFAGCGSHEFMVLRPSDPTVVDSSYLYYICLSRPFLDWADATSYGTKMPRTSWEAMGEFRVELPSLEKQRAIADFLDRATARIDSVVSKKRRLIDLLEEQFLEATRSRVTGGMSFVDPLDVRDAEITRKDWARVKLGSDMKFGSGTTPTAGDERYYGDGIPWIITGNLRDRHVTDVARSVTPAALTEFPALRVHPSGALVVAMYGATVGRLGITAFPAAVNQACCVIHAGVRVDPEFLFYYLLTHRSVLIERSVGAGQPNISQEILRALRLPVPEIRILVASGLACRCLGPSRLIPRRSPT